MKNIPIRKITTPLQQANLTGRFKIRAIADILNGQDLKHDLHRHDFFFILAVDQGKGRHEIDFTAYDVHDHSLFVLRPGQVHELTLSAGATGFLAEFDAAFYYPQDKLAQQRLIKASAKNVCVVEAGRFNKMFRLLTGIFQEASQKEEGYIEVIKANLDILFIEFTRQTTSPGAGMKPVSSYSQERFEEFMQKVSSSVNTHKQVSQYADLLNLTAYQLNAITKKVVGKTVSEIINEQIILEAKRYLLATPNQVKEIADHLGYEDISYFIRFFKKQTGHSPEAFRKNFQ